MTDMNLTEDESILTFQATDHMIPTTVTVPDTSMIQSGKPVNFYFSDLQREKLPLTDEDVLRVLVIVTNGSQSVFIRSPIEDTDPDGFTWQLSTDTLNALNYTTEETVTAWVGIDPSISGVSQPTIEDAYHTDPDIIGNSIDPTGGAWLFNTETTLRYREEMDVISGRVSLVAPLYDYLNVTGKQTLTMKVIHEEHSVTKPIELLKHPKDGFTIKKAVRKKLNITKNASRTIQTWIDTKSLVSTDDNHNEQDQVHAQSRVEVETLQQNTEIQADTSTTPNSGENNTLSQVNESTYDSAHENQNGSEKPTTSDSTTGNPSTETGREAGKEHRQCAQNDFDTDYPTTVTTTKNPDITPVVLLDDDERLNETWIGHYQKQNGELLCGKEYTRAVDDYGRDHYTKPCVECAAAKPGHIPIQDLSFLLEEYLEMSFTEDLPFVLDHTDAAALFKQLHELMHKDTS